MDGLENFQNSVSPKNQTRILKNIKISDKTGHTGLRTNTDDFTRPDNEERFI